MPKKKYPKITKKDLEEGVKKWKEENELPTEEYRKTISREIAKRSTFTSEQIYYCYCCLHSDFAVWEVIKNAYLNFISLEASLSQFIREHKDEWEEEFEDEIIETGDSENEWINLMNYDFEQLVKKYNLFNKKILIKARKGEIVIRRVEE